MNPLENYLYGIARKNCQARAVGDRTFTQEEVMREFMRLILLEPMSRARNIARVANGLRNDIGIPQSDAIPYIFLAGKIDDQLQLVLESFNDTLWVLSVIKHFAKATYVVLIDASEESLALCPPSLSAPVEGLICLVPIPEDKDLARFVKRIEQRIASLERDLGVISKRLQDPNYLQRAPEDVVQRSRERESELSGQLEAIRGQLRILRYHVVGEEPDMDAIELRLRLLERAITTLELARQP